MELTRVPGLRLLGEILHFELRPSGLFDRRELVKDGHIAQVLSPASLVFIHHTC